MLVIRRESVSRFRLKQNNSFGIEKAAASEKKRKKLTTRDFIAFPEQFFWSCRVCFAFLFFVFFKNNTA